MDTPLEIACSAILNLFPTHAVEKNLAINATLKNDLRLSESEIVQIAFEIERYAQENNMFLHIPDSTIIMWRTVNDIIETISSLTLTKAGQYPGPIPSP